MSDENKPKLVPGGLVTNAEELAKLRDAARRVAATPRLDAAPQRGAGALDVRALASEQSNLDPGTRSTERKTD